MGCIAIIVALLLAVWVLWPEREAVRLNLEPHMSDVLKPTGPGSVAAYGIDPRTAPPDSLPAPVSNIVWSIDRPDVVVITPAADGLSCKVEAAPGGPQDVPATLTVSADSRAGVHLVESVTLSVHQDDEAVSLGLKRV